MIQGLLLLVLCLAFYSIKAPYENRVYLTAAIIGILFYVGVLAKKKR